MEQFEQDGNVAGLVFTWRRYSFIVLTLHCGCSNLRVMLLHTCRWQSDALLEPQDSAAAPGRDVQICSTHAGGMWRKDMMITHSFLPNLAYLQQE